MWDTASGAYLYALTGHFESINSVAFSPDSRYVVSGSEDHTIQLWDIVSGAHLNTLEGHSDSVESVSFSPDGRCIVSGSYDKTIQLWDAVSGAHLNTLEGHSDTVDSVSFSPDSKFIVSGSWDNTLQLWDASSGLHLDTLEAHCHFACCIARSLDFQHTSFFHSMHINPAQTSANIGYFMDYNGWFFSLNPRLRLCWIPVSCRPYSVASSGNHVVFGTRNGQLVILDLTSLGSYLQPFLRM